MSTCLVTGGSGFTGRYLIAHLKRQGHRVVALASQPCGLMKPTLLISTTQKRSAIASPK